MQALGQKLVNVGIWPRRAKECLRRYAAERIAANFELYRERAPQIEDDGAWLCAAITDGYADLGNRGPESAPPEQAGKQGGREAKRSSNSAEVPRPEHKQKVSAQEREWLTRHPEVEKQHFHRFRCAKDAAEKQFLYLDPSVAGRTP